MNKYKECFDYIVSETNGGEGIAKQLNVIKELVDKATPKKPINMQRPLVKLGLCPVCKGELRKLGSRPGRVLEDERYCPDCGQRLDWGNEDETN